jgi:hypothetical protein
MVFIRGLGLTVGSAQAIAKYSEGKARTVSSVYARMDVVLLAYRQQSINDSDASKAAGPGGEVLFLPMINEVRHALSHHKTQEHDPRPLTSCRLLQCKWY